MDINLGYHEFTSHYGYFIKKLPFSIIQELDDLSNYIKSNSNTKQSLPQPPFILSNFVKQTLVEYETSSKFLSKNYSSPFNLKLNELEVNFRLQNDSFPLYKHNGIISYLIFYKVPYEFKNIPLDSKFAFLYNHKDYYIPINKHNEGVIIMFPSSLRYYSTVFLDNPNTQITYKGDISIQTLKSI